jgi:4-hydroxy-tetrahydrodipicolinate reductase
VADRLRVVQWATGNIGTKALRGVIEHPALELVGLWVHSDDKVGRDAGELAGLGPVGVNATHDLDEIVALGADGVLYMPRQLTPEEVCALLAGGSNVVTTRGEFHRPASIPDDLRERVETACAEGGTSLHSTGSSPGFITEALPVVLTSLQRRLDHLAIDEFADLQGRPSPDLLFNVMGFGRAPADVDEGRLLHAEHSFGPSLALVADALGLPVDDLEPFGEVAVATRDVAIAAGTIPAGTVAAQRLGVSARRGGEELMTFRANWYWTTELEPAWDLRQTGWRVQVDGDSPLDVDIRFPVDLDRMSGYTANRAVNAVPVVCAAEPGIRTTFDLPQVVASAVGTSG